MLLSIRSLYRSFHVLSLALHVLADQIMLSVNYLLQDNHAGNWFFLLKLYTKSLLLLWLWWSGAFAFQAFDFSGNVIGSIIFYFRHSSQKFQNIALCLFSFSKLYKVISSCRITYSSAGYKFLNVAWTPFDKFTPIGSVYYCSHLLPTFIYYYINYI
jgi:hypothetical protein